MAETLRRRIQQAGELLPALEVIASDPSACGALTVAAGTIRGAIAFANGYVIGAQTRDYSRLGWAALEVLLSVNSAEVGYAKFLHTSIAARQRIQIPIKQVIEIVQAARLESQATNSTTQVLQDAPADLVEVEPLPENSKSVEAVIEVRPLQADLEHAGRPVELSGAEPAENAEWVRAGNTVECGDCLMELDSPEFDPESWQQEGSPEVAQEQDWLFDLTSNTQIKHLPDGESHIPGSDVQSLLRTAHSELRVLVEPDWLTASTLSKFEPDGRKQGDADYSACPGTRREHADLWSAEPDELLRGADEPTVHIEDPQTDCSFAPEEQQPEPVSEVMFALVPEIVEELPPSTIPVEADVQLCVDELYEESFAPDPSGEMAVKLPACIDSGDAHAISVDHVGEAPWFSFQDYSEIRTKLNKMSEKRREINSARKTTFWSEVQSIVNKQRASAGASRQRWFGSKSRGEVLAELALTRLHGYAGSRISRQAIQIDELLATNNSKAYQIAPSALRGVTFEGDATRWIR